MDFRQLRYFLVVANMGSLTHASARIPIAQSALSRHIRLLEDELGTSLLIRTGRGVKLTEQGEYFADRVRSILEQLEDTRRSLSALEENPSGLVRVGMPPTLTILLAAPALQLLRKQFPGISVRLSEGLSRELNERLKTDRLDIALALDMPEKGNKETEKVGTESLCLAVPKGTSLPLRVSIDQMSQLDLILPFARKGIRDRINTVFANAGIELQPAFELNALPAMKELVMAGAGAAVLTRSSIQKELELGLLEMRKIDSTHLSFDVFMTLSRSASHSRGALAAADIIRDFAHKYFTNLG